MGLEGAASMGTPMMPDNGAMVTYSTGPLTSLLPFTPHVFNRLPFLHESTVSDLHLSGSTLT